MELTAFISFKAERLMAIIHKAGMLEILYLTGNVMLGKCGTLLETSQSASAKAMRIDCDTRVSARASRQPRMML